MRVVRGSDGKILGVFIGDVCYDRRCIPNWEEFCITIATMCMAQAETETIHPLASEMIEADNKRIEELKKLN